MVNEGCSAQAREESFSTPAMAQRMFFSRPLELFTKDFISLHLFAPGKGETVIELPDQVRVASTPELEATVQRLFGSRVSFHSLES